LVSKWWDQWCHGVRDRFTRSDSWKIRWQPKPWADSRGWQDSNRTRKTGTRWLLQGEHLPTSGLPSSSLWIRPSERQGVVGWGWNTPRSM